MNEDTGVTNRILDGLLKTIKDYKFGIYGNNIYGSRADKEKVDIGIFGYTGAGKSSLVNTLISIIRHPGNVREYSPVAGELTNGTKNYLQLPLTPTISLWESRGLNFIDTEETEGLLKYLSGQGSQGYVHRTTDTYTIAPFLVDTYRAHFVNNSTSSPLDGVILVTSYHIDEKILDQNLIQLKKIINVLSDTNRQTYVVAVTKTGLRSPITLSDSDLVLRVNKILGINPNRIFIIENYQTTNPTRDLLHTEIPILRCVEYALQVAEFSPKAELHIPILPAKLKYQVASLYAQYKHYLIPFIFCFIFMIVCYFVFSKGVRVQMNSD